MGMPKKVHHPLFPPPRSRMASTGVGCEPLAAHAGRRRGSCCGGRRGGRLLNQGAQPGLRMRWLTSKYLVLRAGVCWSRGQREAPACWQWHSSSLGRVLLLHWAALSPMTPPCCWGAAKRAPGHAALALLSTWAWIAAPAQTVEWGSPWSFSVGFFCAALVQVVVVMDSTCCSSQQLAWVAALPLVTGHHAILYRWIHQR